MNDQPRQTRRCLAVSRVLLLAGIVLAVNVTEAGDSGPEDVPWRSAVDLKYETIGEPVPVAWVHNIGAVAVPGTRQHRLLLSLKETRGATTMQFVTVDLQTGAVKRQPSFAGYQVWKQVEVDGKLYLGVNLPPRLLVYDPATDELEDLSTCFKHSTSVASIAAAADGIIAVGGNLGEISAFDPESKTWTHYGQVGTNFIYTLAIDATHLYGADRGEGWRLISVDRKSKAAKTLLTETPKGYINVGGNRAEVRPDKDAEWTYYKLTGGKALPWVDDPSPVQPARTVQANSFPPPRVLIDTDAAAKTGRLTIHWRYDVDLPSSAGGSTAVKQWQAQTLDVALDRSIPIHRLVRTASGKIVGTTLSYGGMFAYDPATDKFEVLGAFEPISVIGIASLGEHVFVSGYPGAGFARVNLSRPFTTPSETPDRPGIPWTDSRANPWYVDQLGKVLESAHETAAMEVAPNGKLYLAGMRMRWHRGFSLGWYDPATNEYGKIDDNGLLDHHQVAWMCRLDGGRKLAISTRVQPDREATGPVPQDGRIFVFNTESHTFERTIVPLFNVAALGTIAATNSGELVGMSADPSKTETTVFRVDPATGEVRQTRLYKGVLCGVASKGDIPRKSHDFLLGPDGFVWTVYQLPYADAPALIVRIDPDDLSLSLVGKIPGGSVRMLFDGRDLYVTGAPQLRRIKSIVGPG